MNDLNDMNTVPPIAISWELSSSVSVDAAIEVVYDLAVDITRMGEWSPECYGGAWTSGIPGHVGSRFYGYNRAGALEWVTECEVLESSRPHTFCFSVLRARPGKAEDEFGWWPEFPPGELVTWKFSLTPQGQGCVLKQIHSANFTRVPEENWIEEQIKNGGKIDYSSYLQDRRGHIQRSMDMTLERIKDTALEIRQ